MQTSSHPSSDKSILFSLNFDSWIVGGLSLAFFWGFIFLVDDNSSTYKISWLMYYLSFIVNYPHFMASYQLLYWDQKNNIFKQKRYLWAGVIVPLLLLAFIVFSFFYSDKIGTLGFSIFVQVMYITVGWHYVKQVYGMMVVPSAKNGFYFDKTDKRLAYFNLFSIWGLSYVWGQKGPPREAKFFGISYDIVGLPDWVLLLFYGLVALSTLMFLFKVYLKWQNSGLTIHSMGWVSYLSLFAWYLPIASHRHFFYMIPFFHSLQYLLYVLALKSNQFKSENLLLNLNPHQNRQRWAINFSSYFIVSIVLGALFFWFLPTQLDKWFSEVNPQKSALLGGAIFMAIFQLFINVHHYFIDNVIWRHDNPNMKYLKN